MNRPSQSRIIIITVLLSLLFSSISPSVWVANVNAALKPVSDLTALGPETTVGKKTVDWKAPTAPGNLSAGRITESNLTNSLISASSGFTVIAQGDGTVWTWGSNNMGQLGDGSTNARSFPARVQGLPPIKSVSSGYSHVVALSQDGSVWSWGGFYREGQRDNSRTDTHSPKRMNGLPEIVSIAAGSSHTIALAKDGTLWDWRLNAYGQTGGHTESGTIIAEYQSEPRQIQGYSDITMIAAADGYSVMLDRDGIVHILGYSDGGPESPEEWKAEIRGVTHVRSLSATPSHVNIVKEDGTVWVIPNKYDENTDSIIVTPLVQVEGLTDVESIAYGYENGIILKKDQGVWQFAAEQFWDGQDSLVIENLIPIGELHGITAIAAGTDHFVALKNDGTIWTWGNNYSGQLGDGTDADRETPAPIIEHRPAPSAPRELSVSAVHHASVELVWEAPENVSDKACYYSIYVNGEVVGYSDQTSFEVTGLDADTEYEFVVKAYYPGSLDSEPSPTVSAKTPVDTEPPSIPGEPNVTVTDKGALIIYWENSFDNVQIAGYEVYKDHSVIATVRGTEFEIEAPLPGKESLYAVRAVDSSDNRSELSTELSLTDDHGNDRNSATALRFATEIDGYFNYNGDVDYFTFTVPIDGIFYITSLGDEDTEGYLYDDQGELLNSDGRYGANFWITNPLKEGTTYYLEVRHYSNGTGSYRVKVIHHIAPPTNLSTMNESDSSITLAWEPSTDESVVEYQIYMDSELVATTANTSYTVTNLMPNRYYSFTVAGMDAQGNLTMPTNEAYGRTQRDVTPPTSPGNLKVTARTETSITLSWDQSTDNVGVYRYNLYQNGSRIGSTSATTYTITRLTPHTTYTFDIVAIDAEWNASEASTITINHVDNEAPTQPEKLTAIEITETKVILTWESSSDNFKVDHYRIYKGSESVGTVYSDKTTFTVTNLNPDTKYKFTVVATDQAGNSSPPSDELTVVTVRDILPPTAPKISLSGYDTLGRLYISDSSDNVDITGYQVFNGNDFIATVQGEVFYFNELTPECEYIFSVKALDGSGNISMASNTIQVFIERTNGSKQEAIELNGGSTITSYISYIGDVDYYKFVAPNSGYLILKLESIDGNTTFDIHDDKGEWLSREWYDKHKDGQKVKYYRMDKDSVDYIKVQGGHKYVLELEYIIQEETEITAVPTTNRIDMNWLPINGADSYKILVNNEHIRTIEGTSFSLTNLEPNTAYTIKVAPMHHGSSGLYTTYKTWTLPIHSDENSTDFVEVSAGNGYSLALKRDGTVWEWGTRYLGAGSYSTTRYPKKIESLSDIISVKVDDDGGVALKRDGSVWVWGTKLSDNRDLIMSPMQVPGLDSIVDIELYSYQGLVALRKDGLIVTWRPGKFAWDLPSTKAFPLEQGPRLPLLTRIIDIAGFQSQVSEDSFLVLLDDGSVWVNGKKRVDLPPIRQIDSGFDFFSAVALDGTVWTWGTTKNSNPWGELGWTDGDITSPKKIPAFNGISHIDSSYRRSLAIINNEVWGWGDNSYKVLMDEDIGSSLKPVRIFIDDKVSYVSAGATHALAVSVNGDIWSWGEDFHGLIHEGYEPPTRVRFEHTAFTVQPGESVVINNTADYDIPVSLDGHHQFIYYNQDQSIESFGLSRADHISPQVIKAHGQIEHRLVPGQHLVITNDGQSVIHGTSWGDPLPSPVPALNTQALEPNQSFQFMNNSEAEIVLQHSGGQYSYAIYNERENDVRDFSHEYSGIPETNLLIKVQPGERAVITNMGSREALVYGPYHVFQPTPYDGPAVNTYKSIYLRDYLTFYNDSKYSFRLKYASHSPLIYDATMYRGKLGVSFFKGSKGTSVPTDYSYEDDKENVIVSDYEGRNYFKDRLILSNEDVVLSLWGYGRVGGPSEAFKPESTSERPIIHFYNHVNNLPLKITSLADRSPLIISGKLSIGGVCYASVNRENEAEGCVLTDIVYLDKGQIVLVEEGSFYLAGPRRNFTDRDLNSGFLAEEEIAKLDPSLLDPQTIVADPIDASTGAQIINRNLMSLKGAVTLSFDVQYNSLLLKEGPLGNGWNHPFETRLDRIDDGSVILWWNANRRNKFTHNGNGTYTSTDKAVQHDKLVQLPDNSFQLTRSNQEVYVFDATGKWMRKIDRTGKLIKLQYNADQRLAYVVDPVTGTSFSFTYDPNGRLVAVQDQTKGQVAFEYDALHNLIGIVDANGNRTAYSYKNNGQVVSAIDQEGNQIFTNTYDNQGRIVKQMDALGSQTSFDYTELRANEGFLTTVTNRTGHTRKLYHNMRYELVKVVDELGYVTYYTYDNDGNRTVLTDANGKRTVMTYDDRGNPLTVQDPLGHTAKNTYDERNNLLTVTDASGRLTVYAYDDNNHMTSMTDANGNQTTYVYDSNGMLQKATYPDGGVSFFQYENGRLISSTDQEGYVTTYTYDSAGRLIGMSDPLGNTTIFEYDGTDLLRRITDPLGDKTEFTYNSHGDVLTQTDALGHTTTFTYNGNGKLLSKTDAKGQVTTYEYDKEDRLVRVVDPLGHITVNIYDGKGRLVQEVDALGYTRKLVYDPVDRLIQDVLPDNSTLSYEYDAAGRQVKITDSLGNVNQASYDDAGRLITATDPLGNEVHREYDGVGNVTVTKDPLGNRTKAEFDFRGNPITVTSADGHVIHYAYNKNGKLIRVDDSTAGTTAYEYDANSRLIKVTDSEGNITENHYDAKGRLIRVTNPDGGIVLMQYDLMDHLISRTDAEGHTETFGYDAVGNLVRKADAAGKATTMEYDALGRLLSVKDPLGRTEGYEYDGTGKQKAFTDANGNVTRYEYDENGRLLVEIDPLSHRTSYSYDKQGRLLTVTDKLGYVTAYQYDAEGRVVQTTDALGNRRTQEYDPVGNRVRWTDAKGNATTGAYDSMQRQTHVTDALGRTNSYGYNLNGSVTIAVDPTGREIHYTYDSLQRLVKVIDPMQQQSSQTYDAMGRVVAVTDPQGSANQYTYDKNGRVLRETNAAGYVTEYSYDPRGLLTKSINGRRQSADFTYNDAGQLIGFHDPDGIVSYDYDGNGNPITVTESTYKSKTKSRKYDARNRVVEYTDVYGNMLKYTYDEMGNLTKLIYPDGKTVTYRYDALGQMTYVQDWEDRVTTYRYDENGQLISTTRPDGSIEGRTYDAAGQLVLLRDIAADGTILQEYAFSHDPSGNVTSEQDKRYAYDDAGRLIQAGDSRYAYDASGNLTVSQSVYGASSHSLDMTYNADNRLATVNGQRVVNDEDGNLLQAPVNGQKTDFVYDSRNRLVQAGGLRYTYDAENLRISVTDATYGTNMAKTIRYVIDPEATLSQLLMETDEDGKVKAYYVYGMGLLGREASDGSYAVYHYDRRGSTTVLTDVYGHVTDRYTYGAYGELLTKEGSTDQPFLYNGRDGVMTDSNGLYYMRARYYSPEIKRFMNRDVVSGSVAEGQTLNRYSYVNGNPISYVDPFGLSRDGDSHYSHLAGLGYAVKGFGSALLDMATGLRDLALYTSPIGKYIDPEGQERFDQGLAYLFRHPLDSVAQFGRGVAQEFNNQVMNGDLYSRYSYGGTALANLLPLGSVKKLEKFSNAGSLAAKANSSAQKMKGLLLDERGSINIGKGTGNAKPSELFMDSTYAPSGQRIAPKNLYRELIKSQVGRETIERIKSNNTKIRLDYGEVPTDSFGYQILGKANMNTNTATIFVRGTESTARTAQTIIHEVTHTSLKNPIYTQREEVIAFMREAKHVKDTLSYGEIRAIIEEVKSLYSNIPYR